MGLGTAAVALVLSLSAEFGGQKVVELTYSDGSTSSIEAGRGLLLSGGAVFRSMETGALENIELQTTIATKWTSAKEARNGSVTWIRFPLEALVFWHDPSRPWRVGAGATAHLGNKISGTGDASLITTPVNDAYGLVVEGDYFLREENNLAVSGRLTRISYRATGSEVTADGSSLGVGISMFF